MAIAQLATLARQVDDLDSKVTTSNNEIAALKAKYHSLESKINDDPAMITQSFVEQIRDNPELRSTMQEILGTGPSRISPPYRTSSSGLDSDAPPSSLAIAPKRKRRAGRNPLEEVSKLDACGDLNTITYSHHSQNLIHFWVRYHIGMQAKNKNPPLVVKAAPDILPDNHWPTPLPATANQLSIMDADGVSRMVWRPT